MNNQIPPPTTNPYVSFLLSISHIKLAMDYMDKATDDIVTATKTLAEHDFETINSRLDDLAKLQTVLYSVVTAPTQESLEKALRDMVTIENENDPQYELYPDNAELTENDTQDVEIDIE